MHPTATGPKFANCRRKYTEPCPCPSPCPVPSPCPASAPPEEDDDVTGRVAVVAVETCVDEGGTGAWREAWAEGCTDIGNTEVGASVDAVVVVVVARVGY